MVQDKIRAKKQWLAENKLALARILPFIYTMFFNKVRLSRRLNANDKVLPSNFRMIHLLHVMICLLMSPSFHTETEIDNVVKLFLSCCKQFCKQY